MSSPRHPTAPSQPRCRICLCPPTSPFATPCRHVFCYACLAEALRTHHTCPTCGYPVTPASIRPAPPPALNPAPAPAPAPRPHTPRTPLPAAATPPQAAAGPAQPRRRARADSPGTSAAKRRLVAMARGLEVAPPPPPGDTGVAFGMGRTRSAVDALAGAADPLAAAEGMSAEQLQQVIASLTSRLHEKECAARSTTGHLLHQFLERTWREKVDEAERLKRHIARLDADIAATEAQLGGASGTSCSRHVAEGEGERDGEGARRMGRAAALAPPLGTADARLLDARRRRLAVHYHALERRYFADDDAAAVPGRGSPRRLVSEESGGNSSADGGAMVPSGMTTPTAAAGSAAAASDRQLALQRLTEDIAKVTQFSQFRCRATLMHTTRFPEAPGADVFKASNIVSAMEFDRESEFVATAGVTKLIKIFEFSNILRNLADVHYPIKEIQANAKLSWVVWNPYIRYHMASSDYEGVVTLWDAHQGVAICEYEEHEKRAWSVDFCGPNPTLFASGSDDGRVKLWSTNAQDSMMTIQNHANVCSVKFNPVRGEMLAFGSAHHHIHYYDLRNPRQPVQVFQSHRKTVSYVKFLSEHELVSACADSSIKLWNLRTNELERTFTGHTNDRHFVGLSVTPDYIACGSENNAIYTYYKALPSPIVHYRFAGQDPLTGEEVALDEDETLFVSSVCFCPRHPSLLVGANSLGAIKVLELTESDE